MEREILPTKYQAVISCSVLLRCCMCCNRMYQALTDLIISPNAKSNLDDSEEEEEEEVETTGSEDILLGVLLCNIYIYILLKHRKHTIYDLCVCEFSPRPQQ